MPKVAAKDLPSDDRRLSRTITPLPDLEDRLTSGT